MKEMVALLGYTAASMSGGGGGREGGRVAKEEKDVSPSKKWVDILKD